MSIMLGGGSTTFTANPPNAAVPMPPQGTVGWILSSDGFGSCAGWTGTGPSGETGLAYSLQANEGTFLKPGCGTMYPLLCCLWRH